MAPGSAMADTRCCSPHELSGRSPDGVLRSWQRASPDLAVASRTLNGSVHTRSEAPSWPALRQEHKSRSNHWAPDLCVAEDLDRLRGWSVARGNRHRNRLAATGKNDRSHARGNGGNDLASVRDDSSPCAENGVDNNTLLVAALATPVWGSQLKAGGRDEQRLPYARLGRERNAPTPFTSRPRRPSSRPPKRTTLHALGALTRRPEGRPAQSSLGETPDTGVTRQLTRRNSPARPSCSPTRAPSRAAASGCGA